MFKRWLKPTYLKSVKGFDHTYFCEVFHDLGQWYEELSTFDKIENYQKGVDLKKSLKPHRNAP
jgi:hypothetical protein